MVPTVIQRSHGSRGLGVGEGSIKKEYGKERVGSSHPSLLARGGFEFIVGVMGWLRSMSFAIGVGVIPTASAVEDKPFLFSPLAEVPEWRLLDVYQGTIGREEFLQRCQRVFDPSGALAKYLEVDEESVRVYRDVAKTEPLYTLRWATKAKEVESQRAVSFCLPDPEKPLRGQVICLDPGHIGGDWADIEERTFRIWRDRPVVEGEINLKTCRLLESRLRQAGAKVVWTHDGFTPTTALRPNDLYPEAIEYLLQDFQRRRTPRYSMNGLIRWNAELLFYRSAEIQARARRVNEELRPDFTLCLHYNAAPWGSRGRPSLRSVNRLVLFSHGAYTASELVYDDHKFHLMRKLLENSTPEELDLGAEIGRQFQSRWGFPPENYGGSGYASPSGVSPYVWHRNLIANRLFRGPVIFIEGPYMNDRTTYAWIQAGEYEGTRMIGGRNRENIFKEFSDRVADGVIERFRTLPSRSTAFTNYSP